MLRDVLRNKVFYAFPYDMRRMLFSVIKQKQFHDLQHLRTIDTNDGYSLKPFDLYRCIFVHIPKAAGISMSRALFGNFAGNHKSVETYQRIFSKKEFNSYFKFTFVRNPWDRLFSAYIYLKRGGDE